MHRQKGNAVLAIILAVVLIGGVAVVGTAMDIITIPWLRLGSKVQMERDIVRDTYNADNAIYNYEWFKKRNEAIIAIDGKIKVAAMAVTSFEESAGSRSEWTFEDKTEHARLNAVKQGLVSQEYDLKAEYNARAEMENRAIFKDDLPLFFDL